MDELIRALTDTGYNFKHYAWSKAPSGDFGTYGEYAEDNLWAAGKMQESNIIAVVDYYTRDDSNTPRHTIEDAFEDADVSWQLDNIQFESDSGYIHYVWTIETPEEEEDDG